MKNKFLEQYCLNNVCTECGDNKTCDKKCIGDCSPTFEIKAFYDYIINKTVECNSSSLDSVATNNAIQITSYIFKVSDLTAEELY